MKTIKKFLFVSSLTLSNFVNASWLPDAFWSEVVSASQSNACIKYGGLESYVDLGSCNFSGQSWRFGRHYDDKFSAAYNGNVQSCLDDFERSDNVGTWGCHGKSNQLWEPVVTQDNVRKDLRKFKLVTGKNYCLANISGVAMVEPCDGSSDQNWYIPGLQYIY